MNFPDNLKYTKDHEWVRVEGNVGTIGVTDFAQGELGDVVFVELPKVGAVLTQGKSFGTIEAVKAVSDLFAPLSGSVSEVNGAIAASPEVINKDPYGNGWMVKITFTNPSETSSLLDATAYKAVVGK